MTSPASATRPTSHLARHAFTLMKHDGHWRIVALAYTDAP
jgi:hypothetical protein